MTKNNLDEVEFLRKEVIRLSEALRERLIVRSGWPCVHYSCQGCRYIKRFEQEEIIEHVESCPLYPRVFVKPVPAETACPTCGALPRRSCCPIKCDENH